MPEQWRRFSEQLRTSGQVGSPDPLLFTYCCGARCLTFVSVFPRSQVPESAVGAMLIVVDAPRFDRGLGVVQRCERMHVQALLGMGGPQTYRIHSNAELPNFSGRTSFGSLAPTRRPVKTRLLVEEKTGTQARKSPSRLKQPPPPKAKTDANSTMPNAKLPAAPVFARCLSNS